MPPDWAVCERCGAGAKPPVPAARGLLWAGLTIFTLIWIAGLVVWWFFTYRVTIGPLVAGSAIAIDGKPVATVSQATAEYSTLLSRGRHILAVTVPGHVATEFAFRIGWSGIRRHFALSQLPDVACVTFAGAQYPSVTPGALWPDHAAPNEHCAPVGTKGTAEWKSDVSDTRLRQDFQYTNDGDVVSLTSGTPVPTPTAAAEPPPAEGTTPVGNAATGPARAEELLRSAQRLFEAGDYAQALAACNQAEQADPSSTAARALAEKIRKTQAVLEGK
jgi:hypothetical protein